MRLCYSRHIVTHFVHANPETITDAKMFVEAYFPDGFHTEAAILTVCWNCCFISILMILNIIAISLYVSAQALYELAYSVSELDVTNVD